MSQKPNLDIKAILANVQKIVDFAKNNGENFIQIDLASVRTWELYIKLIVFAWQKRDIIKYVVSEIVNYMQEKGYLTVQDLAATYHEYDFSESLSFVEDLGDNKQEKFKEVIAKLSDEKLVELKEQLNNMKIGELVWIDIPVEKEELQLSEGKWSASSDTNSEPSYVNIYQFPLLDENKNSTSDYYVSSLNGKSLFVGCSGEFTTIEPNGYIPNLNLTLKEKLT